MNGGLGDDRHHRLQRHQLAWLTQDGWSQVLAQAEAQGHDSCPVWDALACDGLRYWACHDLPLVVTRQGPVLGGVEGDEVARRHAPIALGLPAPLRWHRRRVALQVPWVHVAAWGEFPVLQSWLSGSALPVGVGWRPEVLAGVKPVCEALTSLGLLARVHGSHGWERLTGLACVRPGSDIDVTVAVTGVAQADAAATVLAAAQHAGVPLDGELVWPDGRAVAWKEWAFWRAGRGQAVLVKHLRGCHLVRDVATFAAVETVTEAVAEAAA